MAGTFEIAIEPLTEQGFAPFGQVVSAAEAAPAYRVPDLEAWHLDFVADDDPLLMLCRYGQVAFEFGKMERHFRVTQTFLPLGGAETVMVVAHPTDLEDRETLPRPEDIRAFLVPGSRGVMLWRGTWHALKRFPVHPPHADMAFLTSADTQAELERQVQDGTPPRLTQVADLEARWGGRFHLVDPEGLMARG